MDILVDGKPLKDLRVVDLRGELEKRGLSKSGKKEELAERLKNYLLSHQPGFPVQTAAPQFMVNTPILGGSNGIYDGPIPHQISYHHVDNMVQPSVDHVIQASVKVAEPLMQPPPQTLQQPEPQLVTPINDGHDTVSHREELESVAVQPELVSDAAFSPQKKSEPELNGSFTHVQETMEEPPIVEQPHPQVEEEISAPKVDVVIEPLIKEQEAVVYHQPEAPEPLVVGDQVDQVEEETKGTDASSIAVETTDPKPETVIVEQEKKEEDSRKEADPIQDDKEVEEKKAESVVPPSIRSRRTLNRLQKTSNGDSESIGGNRRKWGKSTPRDVMSITSSDIKTLLVDKVSNVKEDKKPAGGGGGYGGGDEASEGGSRDESDGAGEMGKEQGSMVGQVRDGEGSFDSVEHDKDTSSVHSPGGTSIHNNISKGDVSVEGLQGTDLKGDPVAPPAPKEQTPPLNEASEWIQVKNLTRPFTLPALKELLEKFGQVDTDKFVTDKIKSRCILMFPSIGEAQQARTSLHGSRWPEQNHKTLLVDFCNEKDFTDLQEANNPKVKPVEAAVEKPSKGRDKEEKGRESGGKRNSDKYDVVIKREGGDEEGGSGSRKDVAPDKRVREWDKDKLSPSPKRRRSQSRSPRRRETRNDLMEMGEPATLDTLFRKTKSEPQIYYLPLTDEQALAMVKVREEKEKAKEALVEKRLAIKKERQDMLAARRNRSPSPRRRNRSPPRGSGGGGGGPGWQSGPVGARRSSPRRAGSPVRRSRSPVRRRSRSRSPVNRRSRSPLRRRTPSRGRSFSTSVSRSPDRRRSPPATRGRRSRSDSRSPVRRKSPPRRR